MSFSFVSSLFLSILLVTLTKLNLTSTATSFLYSFINPIIAPITLVRQKKDSLTDFLLLTPTLAKENSKLKDENNQLRLKAKKLSDLITDQKQLQNLLGHSWSSVPLKLISIDNVAVFTSLDFAHIRPGQPVASGNSLVGLVISVEPPIIKVIHLNHPDIELPVQLDTGAKGSLAFKNSETRIINLDSDISFDSKTTVFTLPDALIPENLIIGQIDKIVSNQANPTQEATIKLDLEIGTAKEFFVITRP